MKSNSRQNKGFTILEALIYTSLLSTTMVTLIGYVYAINTENFYLLARINESF